MQWCYINEDKASDETRSPFLLALQALVEVADLFVEESSLDVELDRFLVAFDVGVFEVGVDPVVAIAVVVVLGVVVALVPFNLLSATSKAKERRKTDCSSFWLKSPTFLLRRAVSM